jgi:NodT family efflux transporter outer membrane factor (OMF) lipoprotein
MVFCKPMLLMRPICAAVVLAVLAGCAVGPDFKQPEAPAATAYTQSALPAKVGTADAGGEQALNLDQTIPAQWWVLFHSQPLNDLVEAALKHNPTVDAARAALRQADETRAAQWAGMLPSVTGSYNASRQKVATDLASGAQSGAQYYTLHTAQLSVAFVPDVFGGNRRQLESLEAQTESQRFQLEATKLTLASNTVVAAIQAASLQAQVDATLQLIAAQQKIYDSYSKQLAIGQVAQADVLTQETQLAQTKASLPPLQKQLAQQRDLLAALAGQYPADRFNTQFDLKQLALPDSLPVSLPSTLVRQRPDIRAAEAQLHAASAQIGVAIANRLPNFQISGAIGDSREELSKLLRPGSGFWSLGANVAEPLFDAGALKHKQSAAQAAYDQAEAQYRATVISAMQNVADSLQAIVWDAEALSASQQAEKAAQRSFEMAQMQLALGNVNGLAVVNAEQAWLQARLTLVAAQANRLSDSAALMQALGGGWWNEKGASTI